MKGDKYIGRMRELLLGVDARVFQNSLRWHEYDDFALIIQRSFPKASEDSIECAYANYAKGYLAVRQLQKFGRTRGEIIANLGDVVESNPNLRQEYAGILTELAENYDDSHETTLAQEFGLETDGEVTLEERIKQLDGRLLRLMTQSRAVRAA